MAPIDVHACDVAAGDEYSLNQAAGIFLSKLMEDAARHSAKQERIATTQAEIAQIDKCLALAMESQGATAAMLDFRPVNLGPAEASVERRKRRLILRFPILKPPSWARAGKLPFSAPAPLRLTLDKDGKNEIELKRVGTDRFNRSMDIDLHGLEISDGRSYLSISFPADIDGGQLPQQMWMRPDIIPPSELAQQKELGRWCRPGDAPTLLESFACKPESGSIAKLKPVAAFDPSIRGNKNQQEALDLIMSGAPLVLVKGPPGTGKTTVITEVVLQSIARGERVLVCSETHQAVANVLERLHRDGRIRMIRHARSDSLKLTDIERDYLEDGSRQGFVRNVRERTAEQMKSRKDSLERLVPLPALIDAALQASRKLECVRLGSNKEEMRIRAESEREIKSISQEDERRRKEAIKERDEELGYLNRKRADLQSAFKKVSELRETESVKQQNAKRAFGKRTGHEPGRFTRPKGRSSLWARLAPNFLARAEVLHERYVTAADAVADADKELSEIQNRISENEGLATECRKRAETAVSDSVAIAARSREDAEAALQSGLDGVATKLRESESGLLPPQKVASIACIGLGKFGACGADETPEVWEQRLSACHGDIARNQEQLAFCLRWQQATESSTKELTRLFWDATQVFLSTCVGLASWRSFSSHFGKSGVDLAIIDEASHATLTQTLIPLGKAQRAVLIGDEMQLPPAAPMELADHCEQACSARIREPETQSDTPRRFQPTMSPCWMERSAFEWITETRPWIPRVMLNRQFRMHPDIADFVADVFYEGRLENGVTVEDRRLSFGDFTKAVCLVSTSAYSNRFEEKPSFQSTSLQNPLEVELTLRILGQARRDLDAGTSFGVVTPYEAQKTLMQNELAEFFGSQGNMLFDRQDIASVDSFQGSERDVMIASFVRSPRKQPAKCAKCDGMGILGRCPCGECQGRGWLGPCLDWVHDLRRLNVAFSRARKMLIMVGDVTTLTDPRFGTKDGTEVLRRFQEHAANRGRVLHVWEEKRHGE